METVRLLQDFVLIKDYEEEKEKSNNSGIIFENESIFTTGYVVKVGTGKIIDGFIRPLDLSEGDKIIYEKTSAKNIFINGDEYKVVKYDNIVLTK